MDLGRPDDIAAPVDDRRRARVDDLRAGIFRDDQAMEARVVVITDAGGDVVHLAVAAVGRCVERDVAAGSALAAHALDLPARLDADRVRAARERDTASGEHERNDPRTTHHLPIYYATLRTAKISGYRRSVSNVRAAMILGAGLGTRLRPLTDWIAKPMVPIGDAPCVDHVTRRIRDTLWPERVVVNVHHRPLDLERWAAESKVLVSHEEELLGTAGGIAKAKDLLEAGDVLVWNGDVLSDLDAGALAAAHRGEATLAVLPRPAGEGNVGIDREGKIVRLRSSRFGEETRGGDFLGIHVVGRAIRDVLVPKGCVVGDVYIPALGRGAHLTAFETLASFVDVGSLAQYRAANRAWLGGRASWAHAAAEVNAAIDGSIVGAGARIDAPAIRSIVWPGTHVREPIEDVVATPFGIG